MSKVRNKLEASLWDILKPLNWKYEGRKLPYTQEKSYVPDFSMGNCILEAKGYFRPEDRRKMLDVVRCNPGNEFLIILSHPDKTISKRSKTSYGEWCTKNNLSWVSVDYFKREHKKICLLLSTKKRILGKIPTSPKKKKTALSTSQLK